jgi:hypothetical protein
MPWRKPDDLELVAECETLPELEVLKSLLASAGIQTASFAITDSTMVFTQKSIFGKVAKPKPYKLLVKPENLEEAQSILATEPEVGQVEDD